MTRPPVQRLPDEFRDQLKQLVTDMAGEITHLSMDAQRLQARGFGEWAAQVLTLRGRLQNVRRSMIWILDGSRPTGEPRPVPSLKPQRPSRRTT